ncbi:MAG: right-handed parallel beta-helix repeat-containing protein, partial [Calditrichia bacterium]|nr:right-handed parallel beta-helix repeat-containing protein [Calditrichia bacterium]
LKNGSPAIGAGSGGTDCGAFGGLSPYILSGIPNLPHIYEADVPASASSESGLQVTIKVKSGD